MLLLPVLAPTVSVPILVLLKHDVEVLTVASAQRAELVLLYTALPTHGSAEPWGRIARVRKSGCVLRRETVRLV